MAWEIIAVGTNTVQNGGNITLDEPAGTTAGDLIIACIAWKDTQVITKPSAEWSLIQALDNGDTDAVGGVASGGMWYCIRGGSAPSYVFTRTLGDVAMGQTVTYRGNTPALDTSSIRQVGSDTLNIVGTTITTAEDGELLVAMVAHGDASLTVTFDSVTNPGTASTTTVAVTTEPASNTWYERADTKSTTGADTGLFIADAIMTTAGATGAHSAVADASSNQVCIVAAFKIGAVGPLTKSIDGSGDYAKVSENIAAGAKQLVSSISDDVKLRETLTLSSLGRTSISDDVKIREDLALISPGLANIYDDAKVSEDVARSMFVLPNSKSIDDTVNISENISYEIIHGSHLADGSIIADGSHRAGTCVDPLNQEVFDTAAAAETLDAFFKQIVVSTFDSVNISETLTLTSLGRASISDQANVSESLTLTSLGRATISDQVNVSESLSLTSLGRASIYDSATAAETLTLTSLGRASVSDNVSASEDLTTTKLPIQQSVNDTVTAGETLTLTSLGRAEVFDTAKASESTTLTSLGRTSVYDSIAASESATLTSLGRVSVDDTVAISEDIVAESVALGFGASISDGVSVSESTTTNLVLSVLVSDNVTAADLEQRMLLLMKSVSDTVGASSVLTLSSLAHLNLYDTATIGEDVDRRLNLLAGLADLVNVSEAVAADGGIAPVFVAKIKRGLLMGVY